MKELEKNAQTIESAETVSESAETIENALERAKKSGEIPLAWGKKARLEMARAAAAAVDIFHAAAFLKKNPTTSYKYIAVNPETGDFETKTAKYSYNLSDFARFSVLVPYLDGLRLSEAQKEQEEGENVATVSIDISRLSAIKQHLFTVSNNTVCEWLTQVLSITAGASPADSDYRTQYNAEFNYSPRKSWARYLRRGLIIAKNGNLYIASREVTARLVVDMMQYAWNGGDPAIKER